MLARDAPSSHAIEVVMTHKQWPRWKRKDAQCVSHRQSAPHRYILLVQVYRSLIELLVQDFGLVSN